MFLYADGIEAMADFSSRGPCEDGRIKPDVVAPGTWIASMKSQFAPDDNAWAVISADYIYQGGTSQAGPQVSGAAAVFVQYYKQQFGRKPSPALVKAALINSSVDMDNESGTTSVPNMDEGWGRVDLTRLIGGEFRLYDMTDQSSLLGANQVFEKRIVVLNGDEELKVTMAYTDVPGFPGAIPVLVNDLDLEVTDPDGVLYRGNRFEDGQSVPNLPTGDRVNNVEGVHLYDPKPGEYIVRVRGINVVQDSRRDTPRVDQDFALVISGSVPAPGVAAIFLDRPAYRSPATVRVSVLDPQKAGQPTVTARVQTQTEPSGEVITLRAAASSILFTGMVSMISGPAQPDGVLQASHGNTLTASYTSSGGEIVRTSRVDFLPPQISNVTTAADLGGVTVTWTTDEPASSLVVYGQGTPSLVSSNRAVGTSASVDLVDLVADRAYVYYVVAIDEAGNHRTNNNNGSFFPFTSPRGKTVLLVNAYVRDNLLDTDFIPLSTYTTALDAARISYDVWEKSSRPPLRLENLKPYRAVIWRINDMDFAASLSASEFSILTNYVSSGGGFFMASMEGLSRFANPSFNSQLANISSFVEDVGANPVIGISGDPVSSGLEIALNYSNYPDFSDIGFGGPDFSDHLVPGTNAAPVFLDGVSSEVVGVRSPRALKSNRGRTVFLAFPLDAAPAAANGSGLRSQLLRNAIAYLAPGADGLGSLVLDNSRYTLPALVEVEAGDADLAGQSSLVVHASSTFDPAGISITLAAASGKGVFQGSFILVPDTQAAGPGRLRARHGDEITVRYTDASSQSTVSVLAVVDTEKPVVTSGPSAEPDYTEAVISWTTSKPTDSLVEFGETVRLGRTAYAAAMNTSHELTLPGLSADRSYFYKVTSRDQAGNAVEHDNNGRMHQLRTLTPRPVPWSDDMNSGQGEWTVFSPDESLAEWQLGVPRNGLVNAAHSPPHAWGTSLNGGVQDQVETFLISPAMNLAGGNVATLRFWHSYDFLQSEFDIINGGEVLIITNSAAQYATVAEYGDARFGWTEEEIDLTPFIGNVIYVAFHNVLFSFDSEPRPGWVVDDVSVDVDTRAPSTIEVFCSLQHARFALVGPRGKSGQGVSYTDTNALPGNYSIAFGSVPFYTTPSGQAQTLPEGQRIRFEGIYTFPDTNQNGVSDLWEQHHFGNLQPRPGSEDQDADGSTLLSEFHAGTDPRDAASNLRLLSPTPQANGALLLSWTSVADRGYRLWHSKDLIQWETSGDWMNGRAETTSTTIPPPLVNSSAFWRVEVRP
ncbi:MAG: hypothetical protein FJ405_11195 [Verrucomicrobia bacterium]|nr:hypothetical protein [Verrucomicrobiota bacterium]